MATMFAYFLAVITHVVGLRKPNDLVSRLRDSLNKSAHGSREGVGAISGDGLEDGIGGLGPDERRRIVVVGPDEGGDSGSQFVDAAMDAALDLLVGEQHVPALDLVEPGGAGRQEVAQARHHRVE
jgi:hypothetical protein